MASLILPLLGPKRVAHILGVEVETLGAWRRRGYGPPWYRIGRKVKYSAHELRAWMKRQEVAGALNLAQHKAGETRDADKTTCRDFET